MELPDLAVRTFGGAVVWANDEFFAGRENLISPGPSTFTPSTFSAKGQVYDGWETRRRRDLHPDAHDEAIVRLGATGVARQVVVDTAHFTGNYPTSAAVDGVWLPGHPSVQELRGADWSELVARSPLKGDTRHAFDLAVERRVSHVRLRIYPDGGVARLRVHGEVLPDPELVAAYGVLDLAALEWGGAVVGCSNLFYGSPHRLIAPGLARSMGEGWETARRRDDGNDWVQVRLATRGTVRVVELDTSWFLGNAPGEAAVSARDGEGEWLALVARTSLQPDTRHRFVVSDAQPATEVRLDVYPDGGMARLRVWGEPTPDGLEALRTRWELTR